MNDPIREAFERVSVPNFISYPPYRKRNGEYDSAVLQDHWETFQEGWEAAIEYLKHKPGQYSDIISDGGFDPRSAIGVK